MIYDINSPLWIVAVEDVDRVDMVESLRRGQPVDVQGNPIPHTPLPEASNGPCGPATIKKDDAVHHPRHYNKGKIEVADFISDQQLNFNRGNAVKYICRAGDKEEDGMSREAKEVQDLEKVLWYIKHEIKVLKEKYGV